MKVLNAISGGIKKYTSKKTIIPLLILFVAILMLMERGPFGSGKIKELSEGFGTLDMNYGYSAAQAYSLFGQIGSEGRAAYTALLYLDLLFVLVYMTLESLVITALTRNARFSAKWDKLNLLPFLPSVLDILENILLLSLLSAYPVQHTTAVSIASVITVVKLTLNYGCMAFILSLGVLTVRPMILRKKKSQKHIEERHEA